jgi:hypothetical protein
MASVNLQNQEIITLHGLFLSFNYDKANFDFKFAVSRNTTLLETKVREIQNKFQASVEYKKYYQEVQSLKKIYADNEGAIPKVHTDKNGTVTYHIPTNIEVNFESEYNIELNKLKEKYKDAIKEAEVKEEEFNRFIHEVQDVTLINIPKENIPSDIKQSDLNVLIKLFNYD